MNQEENFASDSDESDEDFCVENEVVAGDSEESINSDEDKLDDSAESEDESARKNKKTNRKKLPATNKVKSRAAVAGETKAAVSTSSTRRQTRNMQDNGYGNGKVSHDKDELSEDEDESRKNALWTDFLSDVKSSAPTAKKSTTASDEGARQKDKVPVHTLVLSKSSEEQTKAAKLEILNFAGDEVLIEKSVNGESRIKENKVLPAKPSTSDDIATGSPRVGGLKRPATAVGSSGISSLLSQIGKKKKLSVLEKSKLDWNSFKEVEGIDEELQTHNKGKDGYLERQDFLQRTDVRQFEIEKSLRQLRRK